ncbi:MAG TPA: arsenite methyltransferase [Vicinamibacteria bacterium]|nr:arsenite methyltransferase [Vicinamibacteria bacterium]
MSTTSNETPAAKSCCGPTCCAPESESAPAVASPEQLVLQVRERYGKIAEGEVSGCCGATSSGCATPEEVVSKGLGYAEQDLAQVPQEANLGLGCGAPLTFLAPKAGETVLDLGSGPGLDVFLASPLVGPQGKVIGVDMTPAMLEKARRNAVKMDAANVEFREGRLEALPVEDGTVDAVTSNCVINLVPDKAQVFREVARVLRPGGRLVISDIILDGTLPEAISKDLLAYTGCVSGAVRREAYFAMMGAAGLTEVEVLRDVDYLAMMIDAAPEEVTELEARTGVSRQQVKGVVRSITFRARKPAR